MSTTTMTCLCDRTHTFAEGVFEMTCPCGFVLVLTETVTEGDDEKPTRRCRTCHGSGIGRTGDPDTSSCRDCHGSGEVEGEEDDDCDDGEPYDIDDDRFTDPYTGGAEDDGFDTGGDDFGDDF